MPGGSRLYKRPCERATPSGTALCGSPDCFTLLLRQPEGFWVTLFACFIIPLSTLELGEEVFLPVHQRISCEAVHNACVYRQVNIHPFLFWRTGARTLPVDRIDESVWTGEEWEVELVDGTSLIMGTGRGAALQAEGLQRFLAGERQGFLATDNHPFIALLQLFWWACFLFPFTLLYMDRHGRPRSTQSIYIDSQVVILKQYNFMGILKMESFPVATLTALWIHKKKQEKKFSFAFMAETAGRQRKLLVDVEAPYEAALREGALAMQSFLAEQERVLVLEDR